MEQENSLASSRHWRVVRFGKTYERSKKDRDCETSVKKCLGRREHKIELEMVEVNSHMSESELKQT